MSERWLLCRPVVLPVLICGVLAIFFTWGVLKWSLEYGKLAFPPDYDDSHSMVEGALRLYAWRDGALVGLVEDYLGRLPHSFLHYYWAAFLFGIFGVQDIVPYAGNGLFVFLILLAFWVILPSKADGRGMFIEKSLYCMAFLSFPAVFHVVHDFRSEVQMAALFFSGCTLVNMGVWRERVGLRLLGMVLLGMGMAMKPVMFPYGVGLWGLCVGAFLFAAKKRRLVWGNVAIEILLWAVLAFGLTAIHLVIFHKQVIEYIRDVAFESNFYKLQLPWWQIAVFHWWGYSGLWHLGGMKTVLVLWVVLGLVASWIARLGLKKPGGEVITQVFLTAGAFAGIAINQVNQPFFGMTFQLLLISSGILLFAHHSGSSKGLILIAWVLGVWLIYFAGKLWWVGWLVVFGILGLGFILSRWLQLLKFQSAAALCSAVLLAVIGWAVREIHSHHDYVQKTGELGGEEAIAWRRQGPKKVWEGLRPFVDARAGIAVWCANYGWVDANTVSWEALKEGVPLRVKHPAEIPMVVGRGLPEEIEIVILPEPGMVGEFASRGNASEWIWQRKDDVLSSFEWVEEVRAFDGKAIEIWKRRRG